VIDFDRLNNASPKEVAGGVMNVADRLQTLPKEIQSVAAAILFLQVCKVHGLEPQTVFTVAANMTADTIHGERPEWKALRMYCENELQ
jgi:hypothetical protein